MPRDALWVTVILVFTFLLRSECTLQIYKRCKSHSECPSHAKCQPSACDGYTCRCLEGYVASDDRDRCLAAKRMGEKCDWFTTKCMSPFSLCRDTCECFEVFLRTDDGRCKLPDVAYMGESCGVMRDCLYPSVCKNGRCVCEAPYREISEEEFWLDPVSPLQCHNITYSIHTCNGTEIEIPPGLLPTTTTTTTPTTTTTTPTTTTTTPTTTTTTPTTTTTTPTTTTTTSTTTTTTPTTTTTTPTTTTTTPTTTTTTPTTTTTTPTTTTTTPTTTTTTPTTTTTTPTTTMTTPTTTTTTPTTTTTTPTTTTTTPTTTTTTPTTTTTTPTTTTTAPTTTTTTPTTTTTTPTTTTTTPTTTTTTPTTTTTTPTTTTTTPTTTTTSPTTTTTTPTTTTTTPTTTTTTPTTTTLKGNASESASNISPVQNGGLEIFIIPSVAGFVFLVNMLCLVMLTCGRRKRRTKRATPTKDAESQVQKSLSTPVKPETESMNNFKIPRPSLNTPIYTNDYSTWGSSFSSFSPYYGSVVSLNPEEVMYEEIDKEPEEQGVEK